VSAWSWESIERLGVGSWVVAPRGTDPVPRGASIDTRSLRAGQLFAAFGGTRTDGHRYLRDACERGASLLLVTSAHAVPDEVRTPTMLVGDACDALEALARCWRRTLRGRVIAVTGSNGKTTTVRLVSAVLSRAGRVGVSERSFNNAIGVPLSVLNADPGDDFVVCEIGTSSPGEIGARTALVRPDIGAITSIGRAHLEELGSLAGVAREKAQILAFTRGVGIVPGDSDELDAVLASDPPPCPIVRVDASRVRVVGADHASVSFELDGVGFSAPVPGAHNARNAAVAALIGRACGMGDDAIREGLSDARLPEMRLDRVEVPTGEAPIVVYNDAYNANPDSVRSALSFFSTIDAPRKVVVLGDMLELGAHCGAEHGRLVSELEGSSDRVVFVGERFARAAVGGAFEAYASTGDASITALARTIVPGDTVLLKGSRAVALERLIYILINTHAPRAGRAGAEARGG